MKTNALVLLLAAAAAAGCAQTRFSGDSGKTHGPTAPADSSLPDLPPTTPPNEDPSITPGQVSKPNDDTLITSAGPGTPQLPEPCRNEVSTTGVSDPASGHRFLLLSQQFGYEGAVQACAAQSMQLIFLNQDLPDGVLACRQALGTLWLRPSAAAGAGLSLWQPANGGVEDPAAAHWVICYQ